ncbi:MAG: sigma-70 family RNA polymerase sigma factor [Deltaproteobacteria bacterium]|nr:sigma-70 family RNA polymerase sigma factor [Deltaproteobacteria bacterium]
MKPARTPSPGTPPALVEHSFRHAYGKLVAVLVRKVGVQHLERVEDAVQGALLTALTAWDAHGTPTEPEAWLYRVAHNNVISALRREAGRARILERAGQDADQGAEVNAPPHFDGEVPDELLRMLFVCCHESIPPDSRLVMALKTLCGFGTGEIADRLFISEAHVFKRLARARERLRELLVDTETPSLDAMRARLPGVHAVIYTLFNEGYLSARHEQAIRRELCDEAIRLATVLANHPAGATPETFALLALMHLHAARLDARRDITGGLLLLEEQDRTRWDQTRIRAGMTWLARAASGETFTRYHAEAGIAAEHCLAPSFAETRWSEIADLYAMLESIDPSPLHTLNRAVAIAEATGPEAALALLHGVIPPSWLEGHYLWAAVLADLHGRAGHRAQAVRYAETAVSAAPTDRVREVLRRRLAGRV